LRLVLAWHGRISSMSRLVFSISRHCFFHTWFVAFYLGVCDQDFRGNVSVILFNHSNQDFIVKHGDRVAQGILEKIVIADVQEVEELDATDRGAGGFGSTGTGSLGIAGTPSITIGVSTSISDKP